MYIEVNVLRKQPVLVSTSLKYYQTGTISKYIICLEFSVSKSNNHLDSKSVWVTAVKLVMNPERFPLFLQESRDGEVAFIFCFVG